MTEFGTPVPVEEARRRDLRFRPGWYSRDAARALGLLELDEAILLFERAGEAQRQLRETMPDGSK